MRLKWMFLAADMIFASSALNAETPPTPIPDNLDPCWAFADDATYVNQTIVMRQEKREVHLRIPIDYFEDRWDRKDGFRDTAQLFSVDIGSFEMVTRPETAERKKKGIRSLLLILISDHIPMEKLAPLHAELGIRGGNPDRPLQDYERMPGPYELQEIRSPSPQSKHKFEQNIYLADDDAGNLSTILDCHATDAVLNPGCEHLFSAAGLDVSLSYDRSELPNWRRLQDDVTRFLTCATSSEL